MINCHNIARRWNDIKEEYTTYLDQITTNEIITLGPYMDTCENYLKKITGKKYALLTSSGTASLNMLMLYYNVKQNDKVLTSSYSASATLSCVTSIHAIPTFYDINEFGCADVDSANQHDCKVNIMVGLYGDVYDYDKLNLSSPIINDASQSILAKYNGKEFSSFGDAVVLSFNENKPIPTFGSLGAICTDNQQMYESLRSIRKNGKKTRWEPTVSPGYNARPDEDKCAQLLCSFSRYEKWQSRRQEICNFYEETLSDFSRKSPDYSDWNTHKYVILCNDKKDFQQKLLEHNIESEATYNENFNNLDWLPTTPGDFSNTKKFVQQALSIPVNAYMTDAEVEQVCKVVHDLLTIQ